MSCSKAQDLRDLRLTICLKAKHLNTPQVWQKPASRDMCQNPVNSAAGLQKGSTNLKTKKHPHGQGM